MEWGKELLLHQERGEVILALEVEFLADVAAGSLNSGNRQRNQPRNIL